MSHGIFMTGTDTGVGKTHVTALMLSELRRRGVKAAAFKPIACGAGGRRDAEIYAELMNREQPLDALNPIYLRRPLAPSVVARLEGKRIDLRKVFASYKLLVARYDVVLIEGAGGLLVPIKHNYFVADLARDLGLPVLIVARLGLGTINHTLLTVRQARAMGLHVCGIVLNDIVGGKHGPAEKTNIVEIPKLCGGPLLGVVPHGKRGAAKAAREICRKLGLLR
jgi:dethiobiotin synthetase